MTNMSRTAKSGLELYDDREDLLTNVKVLKERISLTERTLHSLSSPRKSSSRSSSRLSCEQPAVPQVLTLAELQTASPEGRGHGLPTSNSKHSSPRFYFSKHKGGVDMVDSPLVDHSMFNSGGEQSEVKDLRHQLADLQRNNVLLSRDKNTLHEKLKAANSQLNEASNAQLSATEDIATYKRLITQLQESIVCLQNEVKAQDTVVRKGEARNSGAQEEAADSSRRLKQCSDMLKVTEERMKSQQEVIKSLRLERDKALSQAEEIETKLAHTSTSELHATISMKEDLQKREAEKAALLTHNKKLRGQLAHLQNDLSSREKKLNSQTTETSRLVLANERLDEQVRELKAKVHSLQCEVTEARTLTNQNTELHGRVAEVGSQLSENEQVLSAERRHNAQFVKDIEVLQTELKSKTSKVTTLEGQLTLMESGLLKQKQRIHSMEKDLQAVDHIKMENIELKCRLEESEQKLGVCQKEILVTSDQLGKLESLATRIESRERLTVCDNRQVTDIRDELRASKQQTSQLQATLDETESRLRLAELASDAKEKIQKKSDKLANHADKARLKSEMGRCKAKLMETEGRCELLQSRMKEQQTELATARRKMETSQLNYKELKQQKSARELEVKTLKSKLSELDKSAQLHCSEIEEHYSIIERLQRQVTSLKKDLLSKTSERESHLSTLQQQCEQWQQQLSTVEKHKEDFKQRLSGVQSDYAASQESVVKVQVELENKQKAMEQLAVELELARQETESVHAELSSHIQACETRGAQLESTLSVTREECQALTTQLHEEKTLYERHLSEKDNFIKEYQNRLKSTQATLKEAEAHVCKLKQELQSNKQSRGEYAQQVRNLEEQHADLSSQIQTMEQTLLRVGNSHQNEAEMLKERLRSTLEELEDFKLTKQRLSNQLRDLQKDKASLLVEVDSLESKLTHATSADKSRLERVTELEHRLKETQELLNQKDDDVIELEARLHKMEVDLEHHTLLNAQFEGEFRRAQNDLKSAMSECEELQDIVSSTKGDKRSVEGRLKDTERSLRRAQEELSRKTNEVEELEVQIQSQEQQLQHRAQQVSRLDSTINSYKSDVETQLRQTREQLKTCQQDRDVKAHNLSQLHDEATHLSSQLDIRQKELSTAHSHVRKLQLDLEDKSKRVSELETRLDGLEDKSDGLLHGLTTRSEEINAKDELIGRYESQVDRLQFELTEAKVERQAVLDEHNNTRQELQHYMDTVYALEQRLVGCEQSQAGKVDGLEEARKELEQLQVLHSKEIARLEEAHGDFIDNKQSLERNHESRLHELQSKERQLQKQLQLSQEQTEHLRLELHRRLELVKNANEAVVIKEAEIARLEAKVSGMERRWATTSSQSQQGSGGNDWRYGDTSQQGSGGNDWGYGDTIDDGSICSSLPSSIVQNVREGQRASGHDQVVSEDPRVLRERATRVLFSPANPLSAAGSVRKTISDPTFSHTKLSTMATTTAEDNSLQFERSDEETIHTADSSLVNQGSASFVSHDDTLARERKELFSRLDELNSEPIESLTKRAVSQTVAHLIQSAARAAEDSELPSSPHQEADKAGGCVLPASDHKPGGSPQPALDQEADGSISESISTVKPGPVVPSPGLNVGSPV